MQKPSSANYSPAAPMFVGAVEGLFFGPLNKLQNKAMVTQAKRTTTPIQHVKDLLVGKNTALGSALGNALHGTPMYAWTKAAARGSKFSWTHYSHMACRKNEIASIIPAPLLFGGLGALGGVLEAVTVGPLEYVKTNNNLPRLAFAILSGILRAI